MALKVHAALATKFAEHYVLFGIVLPERMFISHLEYGFGFQKPDTGALGRVRIVIDANQIEANVETDVEWDVWDLRNTIASNVQTTMAIIGFLRGCAFSVDIIRVTNQSRKIDRTFGTEIPCLAEPRAASDWIGPANRILAAYRAEENDIYLSSCFRDLSYAMQSPDDTGFFCYRAIESLKAHRAVSQGGDPTDDKLRKSQWTDFGKFIGVDAVTIGKVAERAKLPRHGHVAQISGKERAECFTITWDVVERYLRAIKIL